MLCLLYFISFSESMMPPDVPLGSPEWRVQPFMNYLDEKLMKVRNTKDKTYCNSCTPQVKNPVVCPWIQYLDVEPSNVTRQQEAAVSCRPSPSTLLVQHNLSVICYGLCIVQNKVEYDKKLKEWQADGCKNELWVNQQNFAPRFTRTPLHDSPTIEPKCELHHQPEVWALTPSITWKEFHEKN